MSKKNQPVWKMLDQPEPPIVNGYWSYGVVYDPARDGRPSWARNAWSDFRWAMWSYRYWNRKIDWPGALRYVLAQALPWKGEPELQG
jgi:hypothetical protein